MSIKSNQVYYSRAPHRTMDGRDCNLLFVPDKRKGGAFGPNGEKIMLGAYQRGLLKESPLLVHNSTNKDEIKQKMIGNSLKLHEFPIAMQRAGFGVGLLLKEDAGDIIMPDDIISMIESKQVFDMLKAPIESHNAKIKSSSMERELSSATP